MDNPPLVSIILPFRNAESTLDRSIQSIVDQSFTNFQLLLIDNSSTDRSRSIAEGYSVNDSRVEVYEEARKGVVFAANTGLAIAQGNYIARMDADDVSFPERIEKQVQFLEDNRDIDLVSGLIKYNGGIENGGFIRYVNWLNKIMKPEDLRLNQFVEYPMVNPSILMRKKLFDNYGGYEEGDFPEDYEFFLRLQKSGVRMQKVNSYVLEWFDSPARLTRTDNRYSKEAFFKIKAKYLANWLKDHNLYYPDVWIWGAGKLSKRRSGYLKSFGISIVKYIDIVDSNNEDVVHFKEIDLHSKSFILSYVSSWDARDEIRKYLNQNGFTEGINYLICA